LFEAFERKKLQGVEFCQTSDNISGSFTQKYFTSRVPKMYLLLYFLCDFSEIILKVAKEQHFALNFNHGYFQCFKTSIAATI